MTELQKAIQIDNDLKAELADCEHCRFYHHAAGTCNRLPPNWLVPLVDAAVRKYLGEKMPDIAPAGFLMDHHGFWCEPFPPVSPNQFCGAFERGSALGTRTLEEDREEAENERRKRDEGA